MTKLLKIYGVSVLFILGLFFFVFAQEEVSITTYYPSPYGSFRELRANMMAVSPTRAMPTTDGNLAWGNNRGLLSPDQGASIELGGDAANPNPYVDFSNDAASDYDARVSLLNDNTLRIYVDSGVVIRNKADNNWADIRVKCVKYNSALINPNPPFSGAICEENLQIIGERRRRRRFP